MASPVEQALAQLQAELKTTREQLALMASSHDQLRGAHDALRTAHDALRTATDNELQRKAAEITASEDKLSRLLFNRKFELLDMKTLQPETFRGRAHEAFKPWARKVKAFCNAKRQGFRKALEWAEKQPHEITDLSVMGWTHAEAANEKLHDFLRQLCGEGAQLLVDTPSLEGRGFEAWRILTQRFSPAGGQYELDAMLALLQRKPATDAAGLPDAIAKLERDVELYERRTDRRFPDEWKVPALLQILPKAQADNLKLRYAEGLTDYRQIVQNLLTFSQTLRFDGA